MRPPFAFRPGCPSTSATSSYRSNERPSRPRAGRGGQEAERTWSLADEVRLLLVHGALHLCGWDHAERDEAAAMRALERRLLDLD